MPEENVDVVVVQPNFEPHYEKFVLTQKEQLARFLTLSRSMITDSTDYLVYPETSLGFIDLNDVRNDFRIRELIAITEDYPNVHIVTGLESFRIHQERSDLKTIREVRARGGDTMLIDIQNSAVQIQKDGPIDVYFKSKLVPGAEFLPFRDYLPFLKPLVDMLQGSIAGLTGQEERGVFRSDAGNVAPVICYESVYGQYVGGYVRNGADMIFIVTNDGWWDKTPGHIQHLQIGALRAIEHRRPIARSANTGISCFVNIRGDVLQPTKYRETIAIKGRISRGEAMTFYTKWGDMIARIALFMMALIVIRVIVLKILTPRPPLSRWSGMSASLPSAKEGKNVQ
jgi:apolipoprotein N-acyltransferase